MANFVGTVVHPGTSLSPIVGELIGTKISQLPAYRAAQLAAPIVGRRSRNGTYIADGTFRGLNFQKAPNVATPGSMYATQYPSQGADYATGEYAIKRYLIDSMDVPDAEISEWLEQAGVSVESRVADLLSERVAAMHSYLTWQTLGDTSTGFTAADPGNLTDATFSLIDLLKTVKTALVKAQAWTPGAPIDVFVADDCEAHIQTLDEVRGRIVSGVSATNTYATPGMIGDFLAAYMPGANYVPVTSYHTNASGVVTADFSGKILFLPRRGGWSQAAVTIAPTGSGDGVSVASVRTKVVEEMPGVRYFADGHMDVKILNATGGYLAHGLLS